MDYGVNDDYLDDDDDGIMYSTRNYCSDSDEENESAFFHQKFLKNSSPGKRRKGDSEDEFEKEMEAELDATIKKLTTPSGSSSTSAKQKPSEPTYYDNIYFDSDESDSDNEGSKQPGQRKEKHKVLTDDELLYDPLMDDEDQAWVDNERRSYLMSKRSSKKKRNHEPLPHSDAVLSCPACFTTLCLDCQRHEVYKTQFRAMFVFNCTVNKNEVLRFPIKEDKKQKFKRNKKKKNQKRNSAEGGEMGDVPKTPPDNQENGTSSSAVEEKCASSSVKDDTPLIAENGVESSVEVPEPDLPPLNEIALTGADSKGSPSDAYNPVTCSVCNTKIAVYDNDEVYHFFNVITGY